MEYKIKTTLDCRGPIDSRPPEEVEGLLVGDGVIASWEGRHNQYGNDSVYIRPAYYKGEKSWVVRRTWNAAYGYSAEGSSETILNFEEGVKLLMSKGVYSHLWPS